MLTDNYKLLGKNVTIEQWNELFSDFWRKRNDEFAKMMLRKSNYLLIKEGRLSVVSACYNGLVFLSQIAKPSEKNILQKQELIRLYCETTGNSVNMFDDYGEILKRISATISNYKNDIGKLQNEIKTKSTTEVKNSYDIVSNVLVSLPSPIFTDIKTMNVAEFLSYEKIAKAHNKPKPTQNGKK